MSLETAREDFDVSTLADMHHAFDSADLSDGGRLVLTVQYDPDDFGLIDLPAEAVTVTWPAAANQTKGPRWLFEAFAIEQAAGASVGELMTAEIQLKVSGKTTYRQGTRGFIIAPSGQADYGNSTPAERLQYGWIADSGTGLMPNGDDPYLVLP